uniref:Retrotransposon protein, putative, unclassified n=1 Tax=Oryza sativa subsp. japonica TaxID=39947 RepID=Q7XEL7_ORYSJ|nr:retrotransposon protein, putative, unclassified [Oryza sativa Japonica Group]
MSGMKINYQKSEVYVLGVPKEEEELYVDMLNCKVGSLPFTYLGLPMGVGKVGKRDLLPIMQKIEKRLQSWHSGHLSYGGREIRINTFLSSVPMYAMGFFKLPEEFHKNLETIRGRFYWQGNGKKKKYHLIKLQGLCRPKDFGGLGFLDTRIMNFCLLSKWIMKLEGDSQDMSCVVLRNKEVMGAPNWALSFRRNLDQSDKAQLDLLKSLLQDVRLDDLLDSLIWPHEKNKKFTTKSMYRLLKFGGVVDREMQEIWGCKVPLKVKHFLFLAGRGRIPCADILVQRNWRGVVYKAISLMQRWKVLLSKERDREALIVLLEKLKAKLESLRLVDVLPDNISV